MKEKIDEYSRIAEEMLVQQGNTHTKIEINKDNKGSYYFFLNDTIYVSEKQINKNSFVENLVLVFHEIVHSLQSKIFQLINFFISNIEILFFLLLIILKIFLKQAPKTCIIVYVILAIASIFIRYCLEMDAVIKSFKLVEEHINNKKEKYKEHNQHLEACRRKALKTWPLMILSLFGFKITRIIIIMCI